MKHVPARYVFRVDGGNVYSVAMGHVYRCLRLAKYLKKKHGREVCFVMRDYPVGVRKVRQQFPVKVIAAGLTLRDEAEWIQKALKSTDYMIMDIRGVDNEYLSLLRKKIRHICYFDDIGITDFHPDIMVNPSPYASTIQYRSNRYCKYLLGLRYFILDRTTFKKAKSRVITKVSRLLFSFGGADPMDITGESIRFLPEEYKDYTLTIIAGCAYGVDKEKRLKEAVRQKIKEGFKIHLIKDVPSLYPYFKEADAAFVAGGDTCLESLFTGTPTAVISSIEYEAKTADDLQRQGAVEHLGFIEKDVMGKMLARGSVFLHDYARRRAMAQAGKRLVDGKGLERVAKEIVKSYHED